MRNLKNLLAVIITGFLATACSNENSPLNDMINEQENDMVQVQIGFNGELDVSYEAITRGTTEDGDVYGIQVYSKPDIDSESSWSPFAYGLFDDDSKMTINLLKGYTYKFVATLVKDAKNKLKMNQVGDYYGFLAPFYTGEYAFLTNSFTYSSSASMTGLSKGEAYQAKKYTIPNVTRFYGELENYNPGDKNATVKIKMKRVSFGAKFIAKKKAEANGSKLEIMIQGAPTLNLTSEDNKKQITEIYTFDNVRQAWVENGNYTEIIPVTINWTRTDGTTIPLGTHNISFKRNATTVVNIKVVNDASENGVGCVIDESELGEMPDDNETTIEDGEIVDTDIDIQGTNNGK